MSRPHPTPSARARRRRASCDSGLTLPELLITVAVMGIIMAALSSAIIAVLKQSNATFGRFNNARAAENVNLWLPTDLASADTVDTDAVASPCATGCPTGTPTGGSNTIMLSWTASNPIAGSLVTTTTNVSYRYVLVGTEYQLIRVRCQQTAGVAWTCAQNVVIHGLDAPPVGTDYQPGRDAPTWIMQVSEPVAPADTGTPGSTVPADPTLKTKNAKRIVVTINGGGGTAGAGGGEDQISVSAGGTDRQLLDTTSLSGVPTFVATRSRCGGNITLIVDESGSIGSTAIQQVKAAIIGFIGSFAGTPVQLQIVGFSTKSSVLGATTGWSKYFNMLNPADVTSLKAAVGGLVSNGGTNWEDGWFRTFFNSDGTVQSVTPDLVVFFTDGVPTYSRLNQSSATAPTNVPGPQGYSSANGSVYNQEAFFRANYIAQQFRSSVRFIGVGVGADINATSIWFDNPAAVGVPTTNSKIIARLIAGNDFGVPATSNGTSYTNATLANMYVLPSWSQFDGALQAVALAECGGTLTLQTQVGGTAAADPFTYQNTALTSSTGQPVTTDLSVVTTTAQATSGTFDFGIGGGTYLTVEIQPQNLSVLAGYQPGNWSCTAGLATKAFTTFAIAGSSWKGVRVQVGANEAVSCVQNVTRIP